MEDTLAMSLKIRNKYQHQPNLQAKSRFRLGKMENQSVIYFPRSTCDRWNTSLHI